MKLDRRKFGTLIAGTTAALVTGVSLAEGKKPTLEWAYLDGSGTTKFDLKEQRDSENHIYFNWVEEDDLYKKYEEIIHGGAWNHITAIGSKDTNDEQCKLAKRVKKRGQPLHATVYFNKDSKENFLVLRHEDTKGWSQ